MLLTVYICSYNNEFQFCICNDGCKKTLGEKLGNNIKLLCTIIKNDKCECAMKNTYPKIFSSHSGTDPCHKIVGRIICSNRARD